MTSICLNNSLLKDIENYYQNAVAEGASEYHVEKSKKESSNMNMVLGDPDRLEAIAKDFVQHYETRVAEGSTVKGKAMFVASSRPTTACCLLCPLVLLRSCCGQRSATSSA